MQYWAWIIVGVALLGAEVLAPSGFVLMFFGAGAIAVGFLVAVGALGAPWAQWLVFSIISILLVWRLRNRMLPRNAGNPIDADDVVGKSGTALGDLAVGGDGRVELRGATWEATNSGSESLRDGDRCVVASKDGLRLFVTKE